MVPGDMIEWVYNNNAVVHKNEILWSTTMEQWVPIDVPALLISITEDEYIWLSEKGLFHARGDDTHKITHIKEVYEKITCCSTAFKL